MCYGFVIWQDELGEVLVVLCVVWFELGMVFYLLGFELMRVCNWQQFVDVFDCWGVLLENQVYVDVDGNIGWKLVGCWLIWLNWDGLLLVLGDGCYEWQGYWDMDVLFEELNLECGFVVMVNESNLFEGYLLIVGYEWVVFFCVICICEVFVVFDVYVFVDFVCLQNDVVLLLV